MKRFLWLIIVPFLLLNFATAVNISNVDMAFGVLDGGENLSYRFLFISGTTFFASLGGLADDCYGSDVCGGDFFSPGTSLVPRVTIGDFENPGGVVRVNGHTYDTSRGDLIELLGLFQYSIVGAGFVFPPGGNTVTTFTETVDASFSPQINGMACTAASQFLNCDNFGSDIPPAKLTLTFTYIPTYGFYFFDQGVYTNVPVPEPGTAGLLAISLTGIWTVIRRRCS